MDYSLVKQLCHSLSAITVHDTNKLHAFTLIHESLTSLKCQKRQCVRKQMTVYHYSLLLFSLPIPTNSPAHSVRPHSLSLTSLYSSLPLPFPACSSSMEPLSSVLTSLSRCGSRSQCKGAAVPGSPCVCVSAQVLLHGSPPSPMLCLFIAQLSLPIVHCILGKKQEEQARRVREGDQG